MEIDNSDGQHKCCWCFEPIVGDALANAPWGKPNQIAFIHFDCAIKLSFAAVRLNEKPVMVVKLTKKPLWSSEDKKDV